MLVWALIDRTLPKAVDLYVDERAARSDLADVLADELEVVAIDHDAPVALTRN